MKYRDFSDTLEGSQLFGLYVDEDESIIFWPFKGAPGYIVDRETAEKIARINYTRSASNPYYWPIVYFSIILGALLVLFWPSDKILPYLYPYVGTIFSLEYAVYLTVLSLGIGFLLLCLLADRLYLWWRVKPFVVGRPTVPIPRPEPTYEVASLTSPREHLLVLVNWLTGGGFILAGVLLNDDLPGDRIAMIALGFGLFGVSWVIIRNFRKSAKRAYEHIARGDRHLVVQYQKEFDEDYVRRGRPPAKSQKEKPLRVLDGGISSEIWPWIVLPLILLGLFLAILASTFS